MWYLLNIFEIYTVVSLVPTNRLTSCALLAIYVNCEYSPYKYVTTLSSRRTRSKEIKFSTLVVVFRGGVH